MCDTPDVGEKVEVTSRILVREIDRRRQVAARECQRRGDDAGGAAGTLRMSDHRFGGRTRHMVRSFAEDLSSAARFDHVIQLRRRAVVVDVADLLEWTARALEAPGHATDDLL